VLELGVIDMLADLGEAIERHLSSAVVSLLVIALAWIHHGVSAMIVTLLVVAIYARGRRPPTPPPQAAAGEEAPGKPEERRNNVSLLLGMIMVFAGVYWLLKEYLPQATIPGSVALVILGLILIAVGVRGEERGESSNKPR